MPVQKFIHNDLRTSVSRVLAQASNDQKAGSGQAAASLQRRRGHPVMSPCRLPFQDECFASDGYRMPRRWKTCQGSKLREWGTQMAPS
jgi:hypothetical protein